MAADRCFYLGQSVNPSFQWPLVCFGRGEEHQRTEAVTWVYYIRSKYIEPAPLRVCLSAKEDPSSSSTSDVQGSSR